MCQKQDKQDWPGALGIQRIIFGGVLFLVAVFVILALKLEYEKYVQEDYRETCYDAMYWIGIWYQEAIQEEAEESADSIDYAGLLRNVCEERYAFNLKEDLSSDDFCRAGGHIQMKIDPGTHQLSISCDVEGHMDYNAEDVTD